jgi:hypothetical protein
MLKHDRECEKLQVLRRDFRWRFEQVKPPKWGLLISPLWRRENDHMTRGDAQYIHPVCNVFHHLIDKVIPG